LICDQLDDYVIQSEPGSGGMSSLYVAEAVDAVAGFEPDTLMRDRAT
jgi:hypothetical protein